MNGLYDQYYLKRAWQKRCIFSLNSNTCYLIGPGNNTFKMSCWIQRFCDRSLILISITLPGNNTKSDSRKSHPGKFTPENSLTKIHFRRFYPVKTRSYENPLPEIPTPKIHVLTINFQLGRNELLRLWITESKSTWNDLTHTSINIMKIVSKK